MNIIFVLKILIQGHFHFLRCQFQFFRIVSNQIFWCMENSFSYYFFIEKKRKNLPVATEFTYPPTVTNALCPLWTYAVHPWPARPPSIFVITVYLLVLKSYSMTWSWLTPSSNPSQYDESDFWKNWNAGLKAYVSQEILNWHSLRHSHKVIFFGLCSDQ